MGAVTAPVPIVDQSARLRDPLVLLTGTLCDARVFAPLLARLPDLEAHVVVPDGADTTPAAAETILAGLPARFALAGFSLGGIVALEMVAQAPSRVTRLALLDTTARPDPPERHAARREGVAHARDWGLERYAADVLWSRYVAAEEPGNEINRALVASMAASLGIEIFRRQCEMAINRLDSRSRLPMIEIPTLVLCGEQDGLCTPEVHREMANAIPGAQLVLVPGAGHFALIERPDAVAAAMAAWLARPSIAAGRDDDPKLEEMP